MLFSEKLELFINQLHKLKEAVLDVQKTNWIPLSFFSSSMESLDNLKTIIRDIELEQFQQMQERLNISAKPKETMTSVDEVPQKSFPDFRKSLSLNDRFMLLRDVFHGNSEAMNQAFDYLNQLKTREEAFDYLTESYSVCWESDAGNLFRELLEKRFT